MRNECLFFLSFSILICLFYTFFTALKVRTTQKGEDTVKSSKKSSDTKAKRPNEESESKPRRHKEESESKPRRPKEESESKSRRHKEESEVKSKRHKEESDQRKSVRYEVIIVAFVYYLTNMFM